MTRLQRQFLDMPAEKQVAWGLRLYVSVTLAAFGVIMWHSVQKLDVVAQQQAVVSAQVQQFQYDMRAKRVRIDILSERFYGHSDRIRALEVRIDADRTRGSDRD